MNSEIETNNYSGELRIRIPKSLHKTLADRAVKEGVSLNQYCLYMLAKNYNEDNLDSKSFDFKLTKMKLEKCNHKELLDKLKYLNNEVTLSKERLVDDIRLANRRSDYSVLETMYPVFLYKNGTKVKILLKRPTMSIVVAPISEEINWASSYDKIKKIINGEFSNDLSMVIGYFDAFTDESGFKNPMDSRSVVLTFICALERTEMISYEILKKIKDNFDDDYIIKTVPAYCYEEVI